jgi:hypothetical protein
MGDRVAPRKMYGCSGGTEICDAMPVVNSLMMDTKKHEGRCISKSGAHLPSIMACARVNRTLSHSVTKVTC